MSWARANFNTACIGALPELLGQQSKNVSYRAKGQQLFALLALVLNLIALLMVWWFVRSH